ncbi:polyprenol reductase 1-like [Asparagus officinalis]|uniref:polyprenol reductase 1-like n=1 Tax=Asparagus officinalis TaxID=4686 RepID=UPI00098E1C50|nr:polyprenol reductase 1-like [Asparagus officinalis]
MPQFQSYLLSAASPMDLEFTAFLRLAWIAAILPILVASIPIKSLDFFRSLLLTFAARGKTSHSLDKFSIPQRYFLHFYVLAVVLTTCLALSTWLYAYNCDGHRTSAGHRIKAWRTVFVLLLLEAQVLRRLYESKCVFIYSPSARMHILGYFTGLFFYTAAPLSLAGRFSLEALSYSVHLLTEFIVKGPTELPVEFKWKEILKPFICLGWCQWIGSTIFIWGWLHQLRCHQILGSLRENKRDNGYVIPYGDWFEYVSCPHYLSEIVIYAGILVASGGLDFTVWLALLFVVANLVFASAETHRWYHLKFDSYPKSRKAIIPLIY